MKTFTRKKLTTMFIISVVIGIAAIIALIIVGGLMEESIGMALILLVAAVIVFPFEIMGFLLNWKKILIGFIAPIPIVSYLIEWLKGTIYAVKAFISILKKQETFTIGHPAEENEE